MNANQQRRSKPSAAPDTTPGSAGIPAGDSPPNASARAEERELIDQTIGQLLMLVSRNAARHLLTAKIESLHRQIRVLFADES